MRGELNRVLWLAAVVAVLWASSAHADVLNMGGTRNADGSWNGLASLEMVTVGNPGNAADTRYDPSGSFGFGSVAEDYRIGKYEVTAGQYCVFLNAVAAADTYSLYDTRMWSSSNGCKIDRIGEYGSYSYTVSSDRANRPVNFVSWGDVARFCNWLHNGQPMGMQDDTTTEFGAYHLQGATTNEALMLVTRQSDALWFMPTDAQWYKAAYHKNDGVTGNYWDYPTGTDNEPSNDLINPDSGNNANFKDALGRTLDDPYRTSEVGEFENSESPYRTFDQGGNIWEWNESEVSETWRRARGGHWDESAGMLHCEYRQALVPIAEGSYIGFRVASAFKPVPGDANGDGRVDDADAKALAANWGKTGGWAQGDFNNDTVINTLDAAILAANWGYNATTEPDNTSTAVPEPSIATLLLYGIIAMALRRR